MQICEIEYYQTFGGKRHPKEPTATGIVTGITSNGVYVKGRGFTDRRFVHQKDLIRIVSVRYV